MSQKLNSRRTPDRSAPNAASGFSRRDMFIPQALMAVISLSALSLLTATRTPERTDTGIVTLKSEGREQAK